VHHVLEVQPAHQRYLLLRFGDGWRIFDMQPLIEGGGVFAPLANPAYFRRVAVDPVSRTVTWSGELDLDPDTLHDEAVPVGMPAALRA